MIFRIALFAAMLCGLAAAQATAQPTGQQGSTETSCTFQDGTQLSLRYTMPGAKEKQPPEGKLWSPGDKPMYLFTQVGIQIGNSEIPTGAYSMYLIPRRDNWTLIVNKGVSENSKYDEHQDLVRVPMQAARLSEAQPFSVIFAHIAPKQCNIRIYSSKTATWAEFKEK